MLDEKTATPLERTQELFDFLQGAVPDGYKIPKAHVPRLTPEQAWTAIWYLQNQYWQPPDHIERCDICGDLFDSEREGECLDFGKPPYHFCDTCCEDDQCRAKRKRHPDKSLRS